MATRRERRAASVGPPASGPWPCWRACRRRIGVVSRHITPPFRRHTGTATACPGVVSGRIGTATACRERRAARLGSRPEIRVVGRRRPAVRPPAVAPLALRARPGLVSGRPCPDMAASPASRRCAAPPLLGSARAVHASVLSRGLPVVGYHPPAPARPPSHAPPPPSRTRAGRGQGRASAGDMTREAGPRPLRPASALSDLGDVTRGP